MTLNKNAEKIFKLKYAKGNETWEQACIRVASHIANAEESEEKQIEYTKKFYELISTKTFIPGGRILANSGTEIKNLMNCFTLPIEDSRRSIYKALGQAAEIFDQGGGVGYNFSNIREKGSPLRASGENAAGPISFMSLFDQTGEVIQQASRRGAQLGCLDIGHPDIEEFINFKSTLNSRNQRISDEYSRNLKLNGLRGDNAKYFKILEKTLQDDQLSHFNISVLLNDLFMKAVLEDEDWYLISVNSAGSYPVKAKRLFSLVAKQAWESGDPGVLFYDRINDDNLVPYMGDLVSVNPCGEVPLLPYESCCLGSINLHAFYDENAPSIEINFPFLEHTVRTAVRFLDNVQTVSESPIKDIDTLSKGLRRLGLGVMGWADLLAEMGIPYDSPDAQNLGKYLSWFISFFGWLESIALAKEKGSFPLYERDKVNLHLLDKTLNSPFNTGNKVNINEVKLNGLRNVAITSIAPTGCYDKDTEILTDNGWKYFKELSTTDSVMTFNNDSKRFEYQLPIERQIYDYDGKMFHYKHRSFDLLVTPNHRMFTRPSPTNNNSTSIIEAKDLNNDFVIPQLGTWAGSEPEFFILKKENSFWSNSSRNQIWEELKIPINDYLKFMGYYLSEGSGRGTNTVFITQVKKKSRDIMLKDLKKLPFIVSWDKIANIRITSRQLRTYTKDFGTAKKKFVPHFIKTLSPKLIKIFLDAYALGDGYIRDKNGNSKIEIYTASKIMADDLQELFIKSGKRATVSSRKRNYEFSHGAKGTAIEYCVREIIRDSSWIRKRNIYERNYSGKVYCVSVPNGLLLIRRNGFVTICGNSIALLAGVNSGIEPFYALAYKRNITQGVGNTAKDSIIEINPILEKKLLESKISKGEVTKIKKFVLKHGGLGEYPSENLDTMKSQFRGSHEISPYAHVDMQASWQKYIDNSISKTINLSENSTVEDIEKIILYMWNNNLKGGTLYRNNSKSFQILNAGK